MSQPLSKPSEQEQQLLDAVRTIVRGGDQMRLDELERAVASLADKHESERERLQQLLEIVRTIVGRGDRRRLDELENTVAVLENEYEQRRQHLQKRIDELEYLLGIAHADNSKATLSSNNRDTYLEADVLPAVTDRYSLIVRRAIASSQDEVATAHAPIIGPAIRQQIRDSREDMVEALFPIIFEAVTRAIAEFRREIQRSIDAQYEAALGTGNIFRRLMSRLQGVSEADMAIRDVLPFSVEQIFIIHRESGLLVAYYAEAGESVEDSDLIGGMLTAIRDFVSDSFSNEEQAEELNEIQYGDSSVITQTGQLVYAAAVIGGNEPAGFRGALRSLVSDLHFQYEKELRGYDGDPNSVAELQNNLVNFKERLEEVGRPKVRTLSRKQKQVLFWIILILLLGASCAVIQLWIDAQFLGLIPDRRSATDAVFSLLEAVLRSKI